MSPEISPLWTAPIGSQDTNDQARASEAINECCGDCRFKKIVTTTRQSGRSWETVACSLKLPRQVRSTWEKDRNCPEKEE